jgi:hypothetical protein
MNKNKRMKRDIDGDDLDGDDIDGGDLDGDDLDGGDSMDANIAGSDLDGDLDGSGDSLDVNITRSDAERIIIGPESPSPPHENNGWDDTIKNYVVSIAEKCLKFKRMHYRCRVRHSKWNDCLMIIGMITGPVGSICAVIATTTTATAATAAACAAMPTPTPTAIPMPNWGETIASILGFVSGTAVAITKFGHFEQKSLNHENAASRYKSLESNVKRQLALPILKRMDAVQYVEWLGSSFDDLFVSSPLLVDLDESDGIPMPMMTMGGGGAAASAASASAAAAASETPTPVERFQNNILEYEMLRFSTNYNNNNTALK